MKRNVIVGIAIILVGIFGIRFYQASQMHDHYDTEVHVHTDFVINVNGTKLDLSGDKYQSSLESEKDDDVHLHDADNKVVHRHAEGITFAHFLQSIGFTLTSDCFTMDTGEQFCSNETDVVTLYVNNQAVADAVSYVPQEEDRILLYVGPRENANLQTYLDSVTDEACIHSLTCPERGIPPVETCGLTCDLKVTYVDHTIKEILTYVFFNHF